MARYECTVCGYVYDDDQDGPAWDALPGDWVCPACGADTTLFNRLDDGAVGLEAAASLVASPSAEAAAEVSAAVGVAPRARNTAIEPTVELIHSLAADGLEKIGHHGPMGAMGVPRSLLPSWDDIQILPAQLATKPLPEEVPVGTELVIGPQARQPLRLAIPIFVSDMSFGALSEEAKVALAQGAETAGTGIASGEGGMLPEENAANSRYLFELGSAKFGYTEAILPRIQAFHFKAGQAAKTGTGGHLPGSKVRGKIATIRMLAEGQAAVSPPAFTDLTTPDDFRRFADRVREVSGGIPVGMKMSAQHIEQDIDFALAVGVDYIILDGRGGATGAAPLIFRDHISVPTIPALARARRHLDAVGRSDITLIITGGLRTPADFIKALCLGADGIAVANAAIQAMGCVAARICNTNNCPTGIATQQDELRARLNVNEASARLARFLTASVELMKVMARACGHTHLRQFCRGDITTWKREMAELTGIHYAGIGWCPPASKTPSSPTTDKKPNQEQVKEHSMSTQDNIQAAFAGESQANRKYLAFAAKADADGFPQIAKLFRAAAAAETVHAHAHLRVMGGVKDTKQNLQAAIEGEGYEFKEMYPGFIQQAEAEGNKSALISFRNANAVEKTHYDLYSQALATLESGQDLAPAAIYVCDVCGHTHVGGEAPDKCPVCGAGKNRFKEVS